MTRSRFLFAKGMVAGLFAAGVVLTATAASAKSYVVCNQWDECWKVHRHDIKFPGDVHIVFHDDAWYAAHEHDAHVRWLADPTTDEGWYDQDGVWHAFGPPHD